MDAIIDVLATRWEGNAGAKLAANRDHARNVATLRGKFARFEPGNDIWMSFWHKNIFG